MTCRYRKALAQGISYYEKIIEEDTKLLKTFGLFPTSLDNGVRFTKGEKKRIHPWDLYEVSAKVWNVFRPLLEELVDLRDKCAALRSENERLKAEVERLRMEAKSGRPTIASGTDTNGRKNGERAAKRNGDGGGPSSLSPRPFSSSALHTPSPGAASQPSLDAAAALST